MRQGSQLEVNLSQLAANFEYLKGLCPKNEIIFMIKADAYGHGLLPIFEYAHFAVGIKEFGVATLGEAVELRKHFPNADFEVLVFSEVFLALESSKEIYLNQGIIPVISNTLDLDEFLGDDDFKNFPLCIKFNTGMNRLGLAHDRAIEVCEKIKRAGRNSIYHLMTHLSSSSLSVHKNKRNITQAENFKKVKDAFNEQGINLERTSIANSGAIEQGFGLEETHIRPGLMLYGPSSLIPALQDKSRWQGKLISRLQTRIINTFKATKGMPIGYGASPTAESGIVAVIALGYGDGFSTRYSGVFLKHHNEEGRVIGRVNMDMAQLLFPLGQEEMLRPGSTITIWDSESQNFKNICEQSQSIPYEVFLQLSNRVKKIYLS